MIASRSRRFTRRSNDCLLISEIYSEISEIHLDISEIHSEIQ